MIDRREQILVRLVDIFETVPGILKVARNAEDVTGKSRPAIVMHDAGEESPEMPNRARLNVKTLVSMTPQIYILLGAPFVTVGTVVNGFRALLLVAILTDGQLRSLIGHNGDIQFMGCGLETFTGQTREARMELKIEFTYPLDPAELVA